MFDSSTYIGLVCMIAFGLILPLGLAILWLKTKKEKLTTVLCGAATWFVFAVVLEAVPKAFLLTPLSALGKSITENPALSTIIAALLAGIFEESGRFIVFKTLLKKRKNRKTAISLGIGHGGFEALYLLVLTGVEYLVFALLIQSGQFQMLIDQTTAAGADPAALQALPGQIAAITPLSSCIALFERIIAILLHISLSILVFYGVKRRKPLLYVLAVFLHTLFDVPAALYQFGVIQNVYLTEALLAVYAVCAFVLIYRTLYKTDTEVIQ